LCYVSEKEVAIMAYEEYYCECGRKSESGGLCERCASKWESEQERIREYVNSNSLSYDDEKDIERKAWRRMNLGWSVARYCQYRGDCGNQIEDGAEYCPSCTEKAKEYDREEERRRRKAIDDY
jgi:hypothetical protein